MALQFTSPLPLFSPNPSPWSGRPALSSTELRFSRWNNANAEPFRRRQREQKEIEDDLRRHRRYQSALKIAQDAAQDLDAVAGDSSSLSSAPAPANFKSRGTPSSPSSPSIPGRASKYSKRPLERHPAFRQITRPPRPARIPAEPDEESGISIGEKGISYKIKDAPFEFQYSYTETPKVKPLALREPPYLPFGPSTMPRPWTGRAPLPPSKKKLPEFDSFRPPPPGKKGVKPVQAPGPFLAGSGPRYHAASSEEILGEPLTNEEVKELVKSCVKTRRQLNIGRDGLTHNMLVNIHAHWKRRRVCKIKCKGVCTVDMDNVRQQLEEKTGGKIIHNKGGVVFLFRGRNYNYRTRPRYPLMLWKPVAPVYPRLVQQVPEGLTLEEVTEMRKKGHQLPPICKLGKNGVYCNLVNRVKEAFEACELVRINCNGMNKSDCRKIGAKLKDLVPCVLLSFQYEHILIWRGKDWKSSLPPLEENHNQVVECINADQTTTSSGANDQDTTSLGPASNILGKLGTTVTEGMVLDVSRGVGGSDDITDFELTDKPLTMCSTGSSEKDDMASGLPTLHHQDSSVAVVNGLPTSSYGDNSENLLLEELCKSKPHIKDLNLEDKLSLAETEEQLSAAFHAGPTKLEKINEASREENSCERNIGLKVEERDGIPCQTTLRSTTLCLDEVIFLLKEAIEGGSAVILDDASLDPNIVYERSVSLAKTAPPGPKFRHRIRKAATLSKKEKKLDNSEEQSMEVEVLTISDTRTSGRKNPRTQRRDTLSQILPDVVPHGSLKVDELAKLLG